MNTPKTDAMAAIRPGTSSPRRIWRGLLWLLVALLVVIVIGAIAGLAWLRTDHARDFVLSTVQKQVQSSGGTLNFDNASGSLLDSMRIGRTEWSDGKMSALAANTSFTWNPAALLNRRVDIAQITIDSLELALPPGQEPPAARGAIELPTSLSLPLDIGPTRVRLNTLKVTLASTSSSKPQLPDAPTSEQALHFSAIGLTLSYQRGPASPKFAMTDIAATTPWGQLLPSRLSVADHAPYDIAAQLQWTGPLASQTLSANAAVSGNLNDTAVKLDARAGDAVVRVSTSLQPLTIKLWSSIKVRFDALDLKQFSEAAPTTQLQGLVTASNSAPGTGGSAVPSGQAVSNQISGRINARNSLSGTLPAGKFPLKAASANFALNYLDDPAQGTIEVSDLRLDLLAGQLASRSSVRGDLSVNLQEQILLRQLRLPVVNGKLQLDNIDISQWTTATPSTALAGNVAVSKNQLTVDLTQSAAITAAALPFAKRQSSTAPPSVQLSVSLEHDEIRIERGEIALNDSQFNVQGSVGLGDASTVDLKGEIQSGKIADWLSTQARAASKLTDGTVNAQWSISGTLAPTIGVRGTLDIGKSQLAGQRLAGRATVDVIMDESSQLERLSGIKTDVSLGPNRIQLAGALGHRDDQLSFIATLPKLQALEPRVSGKIVANGTLQGRFDTLRVQTDARADNVLLKQNNAPGIAIGRLDLQLDAPLSLNIGPTDRINANVRIKNFSHESTKIRTADASINGTPASHKFALAAAGKGQSAELNGVGSATLGENPVWKSSINTLTAKGDVPVRLRAPASLVVSKSLLELRNFALRSTAGNLAIDEVRINLGATPSFSARGGLQELQVARIVNLIANSQIPKELSGIQANGQFDLKGSSIDDLSGTANLSLQETGQQKKLRIEADRVLQLGLDQGQLRGTVDLRLPDLSVAQALSGPDLSLGGAMHLKATIGGTVARPTWDGELTGTKLSLLQRSTGWLLDDGELRAKLNSRRIEVTELSVKSGEGSLTISGEAKVPSADAPGNSTRSSPAAANALFNGQFRIKPDQFVVPLGPGQRIAISGKTQLVGDDLGIRLDGSLKVDNGTIEIQGSGAPAAPDDLVFIDETPADLARPKQPADDASPAADAIAIAADVAIDLGQQLRVVGSGIRARLVGKVKLGGKLPEAPILTGKVSISDGSYRAYGQALNIERGIVRFNGAPENPTLDIAAMRPNLPVKVGVSITGSALDPTIGLVSTPELSEAEKLSWLVLGSGVDNAGGAAQSLALQQAGKRLLGQDNSDEQGGLAEKLGFDTFGLGYASDTAPIQGVTDSGGPKGLPGSAQNSGNISAQEVVTVGKRLSSKLRISYEQGLRGVQNLLRLQYDVSKRLSVRAQTGSDNAIDLLYFFSFD